MHLLQAFNNQGDEIDREWYIAQPTEAQVRCFKRRAAKAHGVIPAIKLKRVERKYVEVA